MPFPIVVEPRLRYPLMNGRLEPYIMGGVGGNTPRSTTAPAPATISLSSRAI
jgi:hypothetical protein